MDVKCKSVRTGGVSKGRCKKDTLLTRRYPYLFIDLKLCDKR